MSKVSRASGKKAAGLPGSAETERPTQSPADLQEPERGRIYHGDCREVMRLWPLATFDLVFADPPYNVSGKGLSWVGKEQGGDWFKMNEEWDTFPSGPEYFGFTRDWVEAATRLLRPGGSMYVCSTYHSIGEIVMAGKLAGLQMLNAVVWHKTNAMPNVTRRMFAHSVEFLLLFAKGRGWTFNYDEMKGDNRGRQMRDLWPIPVCQGDERVRGANGRAAHPTQKPQALVSRAIRASSNPGDLVLDPFMGSGTTAVVCNELSRQWVGIEVNPRYIEIALRRIAGTTAGSLLVAER